MNYDVGLVRLNAPDGGDNKGREGEVVGLINVDLVLECHARFMDMCQVEGVLPDVVGDCGDESGIGGDLFEKGEVLEAEELGERVWS